MTLILASILFKALAGLLLSQHVRLRKLENRLLFADAEIDMLRDSLALEMERCKTLSQLLSARLKALEARAAARTKRVKATNGGD